jgi:Leucine-rich repeat (LRR) protein
LLLAILSQSGNEPQPALAIPSSETRTTSVSYRPITSEPDSTWLQQLTKLPAERQGEAVAAKLRELNPGFDGRVEAKVKGSFLVELQLNTDAVRDISPLRALTGLTRLVCSGQRGQLTDLGPLRGLPISDLNCSNNQDLRDLSPLAGMPLTILTIYNTAVEDLEPLRGTPLGTLSCSNAPIRSLEPLRGGKLWRLYCNGTQIADLAPLASVPIVEASLRANKITSLAPLLKTSIRVLHTDLVSDSDLQTLAAIKTLEKINGEPAGEFLKKRKTR